MSTPALNPLVTKIRAAHPGAYDDMDDATLTKKVLAKYPQYSDLAVNPIQKPRVDMQSEGPVGSNMTSFETQLAGTPGRIVDYLKHPFQSDAYYQAEGQKPIMAQLGDAFSRINPVSTTDAGTPNEHTDWGATGANILPLLLDVRGGGLAESPVGQATRAAIESPIATAPIRYGARAAEAVANSKFRPLAKIMTPADEAYASRVKIPGRDIGLGPPTIYPGAKYPANPGAAFLRENQGVYPGAPLPETPTAEQLNPSLVSPSRTMPGQISPERIIPEESIPGTNARPSLHRIMPDRGLLLRGDVGPVVPMENDPILDKLRGFAAKIEKEGHGPEPPAEEETTPRTIEKQDLTPALKRSLKKVNAAKSAAAE